MKVDFIAIYTEAQMCIKNLRCPRCGIKNIYHDNPIMRDSLYLVELTNGINEEIICMNCGRHGGKEQFIEKGFTFPTGVEMQYIDPSLWKEIYD